MKQWLTFSLVFLAFLNTRAQTADQISGTVKDQNGAVVAGAQISINGKQFKRETITDSSGAFDFQNTLSGNYDLRISAEGFTDNAREINSSDAKNLEIVLQISEANITVTAEIGNAVERVDVPQAVNLIGSEAISDRASTVLAEAAAEEAGVNVQRTSPTLGGIFVRGLAGKNVVVYVDGVRYTNSAQRGGINSFFNLNEPSALQSIEILRGASSAQFSSDALGGTINLISKNPFTDTITPTFRGEINTNFQSADRSFGSSAQLSYGTNRLNGFVNLAARRINTLRTAGGVDSHAAVTRFLGLPSTIFGKRLPDTEFTQYGGTARFNYATTTDSQLTFHYQRGQQDDGKRYDQLLGGDGNLIADLRNLMLDFGYLRFVKSNFFGFDSASFTASYNSQREERVNQGGQGDPFGSVTHQYERTSATGASFYLDKNLPFRNSFVLGGDFYFEKINAPAYTLNPRNNVVTLSRPRVPNEARFASGGLFVQNSWQAIPDRLRFSGALRYSIADYKARAADSPVVGNRRLWQNDDLRVGSFSGRIGAVVRIAEGLRVAANYSRGFRAPSMTDLGTLGLTGDGFQVDFQSARNLNGPIGTTAGADAVSTGLAIEKQRSEFSNNFDLGVRYSNRRFETELTGFVLDLEDTITKQSLILPLGASEQFFGDQRITVVSLTPNATVGTVFVPAASNPVLIRANYTAARLYGFEYEAEARLTREIKFTGNYTYIYSKDKATGLPPNIEGGTPPPTGFVSFRYDPNGKPFWIEIYSTLAAKQDRLSSLDLSDRRTGATRSRSQIANFFRRGACVRGLTDNPDGICGSGDETILTATGETLTQVQNRVLGSGVDSAPLFTYLPGYAIANLRGGFRIGEKSQILWAFENIFDRPYRNPSWGIDGAGRSFRVAYRLRL